MMTSSSNVEQAFVDLDKSELKALALALDPVKFARSLGFNPVEWQQDLLKSKDHRIIMNCPRGAGKSLLTALITLHEALYIPNSFILMFSRSERQSMELFKKVLDYYRQAGYDTSTMETAHRLELSNGSRIMSLPSSVQTVVGYHNVTLLIIDEAATIKDELYMRSRPMLDHLDGRLFLLSTPFGRSGFFYNEWSDYLENKDTTWKGITVTTKQCPWMTESFLKEERDKLGEWWYSQEYQCEFRENSESVFTIEEIENAFSPDVKPLFDPVTGELDVPVPDKPIARGMIDSLGWEI
jgi:hypothetical protein